MPKDYREHWFSTESEAQKKVKQMKHQYGYNPSIFKVTPSPSKKGSFAVIQPKGLTPIKQHQKKRK